MFLTILGCGSSTGVPRIGCTCPACRSPSKKNHRLRASAWISSNDVSVLIDTSADLRQQALNAKIKSIDAVLYTHPHSDHISGIDDLRAFNFIQKGSIALYGNEWTRRELTQRYNYIFNGLPAEGGGKPDLTFHLIKPDTKSIEVNGVFFKPIPLVHGSNETLGYRIKNVAYITDCNKIEPKSLNRLLGVEILILDCLRIVPHQTHFNLEAALNVVSMLKPKKTFLTHLGHEFEFGVWKRKLPKNINLAYDGLKVKIN